MMGQGYFFDTLVNIDSNSKLRKPQIESYLKIKSFYQNNPSGEALVVLPTGTGKSGLISIAPYGVSNGRVLIITPGLVTNDSIDKTIAPLRDNFLIDRDVIFNIEKLPVVVAYNSELRESDLYDSNIVYANIHKIVATKSKHGNSLVENVPNDFFDLIIIDECHHSVANSWVDVLNYFKNAKKLHVTGTPYRGDGQELPGEVIHETSLSEVMRNGFVKSLRKQTVNAHSLEFILPEQPNVPLTKEEVLQFKDIEWLQKNIALSDACSLDVIDASIEALNLLKESSPKVPHKVLAVGCSIAHAERLHELYYSKGINSVIVHSELTKEDTKSAFVQIDTNQCDVVISVNMLMEGYDHKYLTVLALFRPYRSLNAFAQVIGRVLRAIPDEEITDALIDNNAVVIYHSGTGLDDMWRTFQKDVDRSKQKNIRDYDISEFEYVERSNDQAIISTDGVYIGDKDSYLLDVDFNQLFEQKRQEIKDKVSSILEALPEEFRDAAREGIEKKVLNQTSPEIDEILLVKRPAAAREQLRTLLKDAANNGATDLLSDYNLDPKDNTLYESFRRVLYQLPPSLSNDGILVRYINSKLFNKYGPVGKRTNDLLMASLNEVTSIVDDLRSILNGIEHK